MATRKKTEPMPELTSPGTEIETDAGTTAIEPAPVPAVEPRKEAEPPAPPQVPTAPEKPKGPSFGQRLGRAFIKFLRALLLLILLISIVAGLYVGVPILYEKYILPIQKNTEQLAALKARQDKSETQTAGLQERLVKMETQLAKQNQSIEALDTRVKTLEEEIATHTATLKTLDEMQNNLTAQNLAYSVTLDAQIKLLKAMELLSRARLFLYQSNFGLAKQDVDIARTLLAEVRSVDIAQPAEIDETISRLDRVLANLPDFPVAASDDLDIAWQILLSGLPASTPTPESTPTPTPLPGDTPTPGPTP